MRKGILVNVVVFALLFCAGYSQSVIAAEFPEAPSSVAVADQRTTESGPSDRDGGNASKAAESHSDQFLGYWLKRGLHDQASIYTAPFHESALKWDIALPAITLGLIAIDKHASGALSRSGTGVSNDISNVGLFTSAGTVGLLLLDGELRSDSHARETGILGGESMANSGLLYIALQLITERDRPLQDAGEGHFFQTSGLNNSFPSGHAILTWSAASAIAHEYPKPWIQWLTYGTAAAVSVTRFTSLQHFPSDVVVGSTLGSLVGRHVFHRHCDASLSPACKTK